MNEAIDGRSCCHLATIFLWANIQLVDFAPCVSSEPEALMFQRSLFRGSDKNYGEDTVDSDSVNLAMPRPMKPYSRVEQC